MINIVLRNILFLIPLFLVHIYIFVEINFPLEILTFVIGAIAFYKKEYGISYYNIYFAFYFFFVDILPIQIVNVSALYLLSVFLITFIVFLPFHKFNIIFNRIKRHDYIIVAIISILSTFVLIVWAKWSNDLGAGEQMIKSLAFINKWIIFLIMIPVFSILNAFAEELIFRELIQQVGQNVFNLNQHFVIFSQSTAFAAIHYLGGFPNGTIGYIMVLVYGLILGYLRHIKKGLALPLYIHIFEDIFISMYLAYIFL